MCYKNFIKIPNGTLRTAKARNRIGHIEWMRFECFFGIIITPRMLIYIYFFFLVFFFNINNNIVLEMLTGTGTRHTVV